MVLLIGRWVVARSTFCVTIQFSLPLTLPSPFPLPGYLCTCTTAQYMHISDTIRYEKIKSRPFQGLNPRPQDFLCKSQGRGGEGGGGWGLRPLPPPSPSLPRFYLPFILNQNEKIL